MIGALPLGRMQDLRCEPPAPNPGTPEAHGSWHIPFQRNPLEHLQCGPPNMERPQVTTVIWGLGYGSAQGALANRLPGMRRAGHRPRAGARPSVHAGVGPWPTTR